MNTYIKFLLTVFFSLFLLSCAQPVADEDDLNNDDNGNNNNLNISLVDKVGADNTFEILTWNIENFPEPNKNQVDIPKTVHNVKTIIRNLDVDLIAVQEIGSISSFNTLVDSLAGWQGVLSSDTYGTWYQKTGFLYKSDLVSISNVKNIFNGNDDWYAFPRPPLTGYVELKDKNGTKFDFNLIVLHLKAYADDESAARRQAASEELKEFIDAEIAAGADPDFIVLGDWNDQISDPETENVFNVFLDDTANYSFLTSEITDRYSYISSSYTSLIDHIMISKDARQEYGEGNTDVLYLDHQFRPYPDEVSDHRPVMAIFKGFSIE